MVERLKVRILWLSLEVKVRVRLRAASMIGCSMLLIRPSVVLKVAQNPI